MAEKIIMSRRTFERILDYFWDPCTDDDIPIIAEIKARLETEFPEEFEFVDELPDMPTTPTDPHGPIE